MGHMASHELGEVWEIHNVFENTGCKQDIEVGNAGIGHDGIWFTGEYIE